MSEADYYVGLVSLSLELRETQISGEGTTLKPDCPVSNPGSGLAVHLKLHNLVEVIIIAVNQQKQDTI